MDTISFYNRILTDQEREVLYSGNMNARPLGLFARLVLWIKRTLYPWKLR